MIQVWIKLEPRAHIDQLGLIAEFVNVLDDRPAVEQLTENYGYGWHPQSGFVLGSGAFQRNDPRTFVLKYEGDPDMAPLFVTYLRDETVAVYEYGCDPTGRIV